MGILLVSAIFARGLFILTRCRVLNPFIYCWDLKRPLKMAGSKPAATQKPGFLENLSAITKDFGKNPVSRPPP